MKKKLYLVLTAIVFLPSCRQEQQKNVSCVIPEQFITKRDRALNVDSVAVWHGNQGQHWLIATAKSTHSLPVYDASTGELIKIIGEPGFEGGQFQRPNGIAIEDDILFIVERDNKRLQILDLPDGKPLGYINDVMQRPYGLAVVKVEPNKKYMVYITDNHGPVDVFHPKKIHQYEVNIADGKADMQLVRTFGDDEGPGALWKLESIAVDPAHNRLFIADEHEQQKNVKIYTLDGKFSGKTIGDGLIEYEPEGIALYETSPEQGYVIVTDQDREGNQFYIFDRSSLMPIKPFKGKIVRNTDGIAITNRAFGPFTSGAFYAVHDDGNICAYDWRLLATLCGLQEKRALD